MLHRSLPVSVPLAVGFTAWHFSVALQPQILLPAAALTTAALMGLSAITFTRLKDAAAVSKPEVGVDPATTAYQLFRRVNRAAVEALLLGGLCVLGMCIGERWQWITSAALLAGLTYVGIRLLGVLLSLRQQAEHVIGDRYVPIGEQSKPDIRIAQ
ncbi:hypothetical protein ABG82_09165 [Mycobacteroides immunogenum]|uniref:Uncharacterized protein n=2 Tax=Mycobacteroides immunogenum TaxID=83262 RepID=A0A7V8RXH7_9MYCO|nr:hypothetical protein [Mycobacteroides immunogenum]AMT70473.1 hypothetical protein ABG82_09165 [Mycobacteroides immunogenum]KPG13561.1 hypothetical protein AN909_04495 [Mycobacteroides immunogenum]KPG14518.1 hypothetical protein AN908_08370 [Mycobacteroides immunogenum]KPG17276.1 hypothetical protein AN910_03720 [Mycobacteroides immunogenum]KPG24208.1 hypothetical protein AN911_01895 [Mycobacteroides immunogenum]